jgi:hypothetical protein
MEETGLIFTGQIQSISSPHGTDIQCLRTEAGVVSRAGGRREVENVIDVTRIEVLADVLLYQGETRFVGQTRKVGCTSGGKIIYTDYMMTLADKCVAQMRAEEAGGAGDQDTLNRQNTVPLG